MNADMKKLVERISNAAEGLSPNQVAAIESEAQDVIEDAQNEAHREGYDEGHGDGYDQGLEDV